jgi:hypothetical protein
MNAARQAIRTTIRSGCAACCASIFRQLRRRLAEASNTAQCTGIAAVRRVHQPRPDSAPWVTSPAGTAMNGHRSAAHISKRECALRPQLQRLSWRLKSSFQRQAVRAVSSSCRTNPVAPDHSNRCTVTRVAARQTGSGDALSPAGRPAPQSVRSSDIRVSGSFIRIPLWERHTINYNSIKAFLNAPRPATANRRRGNAR